MTDSITFGGMLQRQQRGAAHGVGYDFR